MSSIASSPRWEEEHASVQIGELKTPLHFKERGWGDGVLMLFRINVIMDAMIGFSSFKPTTLARIDPDYSKYFDVFPKIDPRMAMGMNSKNTTKIAPVKMRPTATETSVAPVYR